MDYCDVVVIGGGPAGLSAAIQAAESNMRVILFDRGAQTGGQLLKQTHKFFGSREQFAGQRGFHIAENLSQQADLNPNIEIKRDTVVLGIYEDGVITYKGKNCYGRLTAGKTILATGASEKMLLFENNDLPGVTGAGAIQTLMNQYGIRPGKNVLMVGAGNIGLIVSYQLIQAGINVKAVIDAAPRIGGYLVHASKVRRLGVPIYLQTTVIAAEGSDCVEAAVIAKVDENFQPIQGTEERLEVDTICIAAGLAPLKELLTLTGAEIKYIPELGGYVPVRDQFQETTVKGYYVAGDLAGIEEATTAILEGSIAGLSAAIASGNNSPETVRRREKFIADLAELRSGPVTKKIRSGMAYVTKEVGL